MAAIMPLCRNCQLDTRGELNDRCKACLHDLCFTCRTSNGGVCSTCIYLVENRFGDAPLVCEPIEPNAWLYTVWMNGGLRGLFTSEDKAHYVIKILKGTHPRCYSTQWQADYEDGVHYQYGWISNLQGVYDLTQPADITISHEPIEVNRLEREFRKQYTTFE